MTGGEAHAFDGSVSVAHVQVGEELQDLCHVGDRSGFPAGEGDAYAAEGVGVFVDEVVEETRGQLEHGDAVLGDQALDADRLGTLSGLEDACRAVQQRTEQLQCEAVPGHGRALQEHFARAEVGVVLAEVGAQQGTVRGGDTLGASRRAGREHYARHIIRTYITHITYITHTGHDRARRIGQGVDTHRRHPRSGCGDRVAESRTRDHRAHAGFGEDTCHPFGRELRVQQGVSGTGLQYGQQGDHHVHPALKADTHHRACIHQPRHEPVGPLVQLGVRHALVSGDQRNRFRSLPCLLLEHLVERPVQNSRRHPVRVIPHRHDPVSLTGAEQLDRAHGRLGVSGSTGQQTYQPVRHRLRRRPVEEVPREHQLPVDASRAAGAVPLLGEGEVQVEFRGRRLDGLPGRGQPRQVEPAFRVVLEDEHGLEERMPCRRPVGVDLLDQSLERHVLVGERGEVRLPDSRQQLAERRISRQVRAEHECVDEEADEVVQGLVRASRDHRAEGDVGSGAEPRQKCGEARLQHHEEGHAVPAGQVVQLRVQSGVQAEADHTTPVTGHGRPWTVGRKAELLRGAGERVRPVRELAVQHLLQVLLVPEGVIGVLHRQRLPRRSLTRTPGPVCHRQVFEQRSFGPPVARNVVQGQQQHVLRALRVLRVAHADQGDSQRQVSFQVEPGERRLGDTLRQLLLRALHHREVHSHIL